MIWSFMLVAAFGLVLIVAANQLRWSWWWRALGALLLTAVVFIPVHWLIRPPPTLGSTPDWHQQLNSWPFRELILFGALLFGMIARVLSLAIERRDADVVGGGTKPDLKIDRWQFVYPMLFAIPTFGGLLSQTQTSEVSTTSVVMAFQTGFFWQTILKRLEPK